MSSAASSLPAHSKALDLEPIIAQLGQDLVRRSAGALPTVFDSRWWANAMLDWAMKDEAFKVQLFRFIDVLPALQTDEAVGRLLHEYFEDATRLQGPLHWGLRAMRATSLGTRLTAKSFRRQVQQMASIFIAGATVSDALSPMRRLWSEGRGFSVDLLGEATVSEFEADQYRERCLDALKVLHAAVETWPAVAQLERDHLGALPRVHLSVKLSALYSQLDGIDPVGSYAGVAARLRPILDQARTMPAAITFDMEQAELKDVTLFIFQRLLSEAPYRDYPYAGIALQAYHKESARDLEALLGWAHRRGCPITIRLVKGAYWDSDTIRYQNRHWPLPVFERKADTDANYEALTRVLLEHTDVIRPAFGTHNLRSVAHADAAAQAQGLRPDAYEFQMIFGMAEPLQSAVVARGRRVRLYTPVGELLPGMAYLVRRLLENTSNESFLRREYAESEPLERLLAPPITEPGARAESSSGVSFWNEAHTDFSRADARAAMQDALHRVRSQLGARFALPAVSWHGPDLISRNPSDPTEEVGRVPTASVGDVPAAVTRALECRGSWRAVPPSERAAVLVRAAELMRARRFELAAWEILEVGKPWRDADADVAEAIDFLEFYAQRMGEVARPRRLGNEPGELNEISYAPRGLVAVVSPWNFPLAIPAGMVAAALVAGNPVLYKPSERSPIMGYWLSELLRQAGLPEGVLQVLPGGPEVGRRLVADPAIAVIAFTGSKEVGLRILAQSAQVQPGQAHVPRVIAEMGGKNAIIVDETADLDEAVTGVATSFTGYQGQKCSACSRVIVLDGVHDTFLQRLTEAVASLKIGPPEDPANRIGPMIDERARAKVREYIQIGRQEAQLVVSREVPGTGYFIGPTIFRDVQPQHRLAQEEIFGPVLAVMRAKDFDEALRLADSTSYALTGGLYSRSPANIARARTTYDVGNLYINRAITGALVGRQPFGGHRLSGVGAKAGGDDYLQQFLTARVVSENTIRRGFAPSL